VVLGAADTAHRVALSALGCVAYWLLTGRMVFEGETAMQVMIQHVQAEPDSTPYPATRDATSIGRQRSSRRCTYPSPAGQITPASRCQPSQLSVSSSVTVPHPAASSPASTRYPDGQHW
jgi:hypothetical protein